MIKLNNQTVDFTQFPNGEIKLNHHYLHDKNVTSVNEIIFKYENDSDFIRLFFLKSYLDTYKAKSNLVVTYLPYSRMDRSEDGSPFTLKYITKFINDMGFEEVLLIEPHSDVSVALLNNASALYINYNLLPKVLKGLNFDSASDYIMFPDAGSSKRYSKMKFKNVIVGNKTRDFETGKINGLTLHSDFKGIGDKVVIVDDLSSYGGTFIKSAEALRNKGFKEIYLLVAHAENSIFKGELFSHIDKLFTTDSLLTEHRHWENIKYKNQLKIFNIEEVLINE